MGPTEQFWKDLESWTWTTSVGDVVTEHRTKTKTLGQAGMVRELAMQLMQLQRSLAPVTPQPELTTQAPPYAQNPTEEKKELQRTRAPVTPQPVQTVRAPADAQQPAGDDKEEDDDIDGEHLS